MLSTKTPDESGWYWIESGDEWHMAYLWTEEDELELALAIPEHTTMERYYPRSPGEERLNGHKNDILVQRWIGPLDCPGDFSSEIAEWSIQYHEAASRAGKVLVMVAIDRSYCGKSHGRSGSICFGMMDHDEAMAAQGRAFEVNENRWHPADNRRRGRRIALPRR